MTVSVATHQSYIIRSLPCTLQNCLAYIISILRIFPLLLAPLHVLLSVQFQLDAIKYWPFLYYSRRPTGRTWANILYFVWLCVSGITTGTRRIMRPGELALRKTSFKTPYEGQSRPIIRLVPVPMIRDAQQARRTTKVCPSSSRRIRATVV